jgi:Cu-Zn family superoxide dismutase
MRLPVLIVSLACLATASAIAQAQDAEPFRIFFDWGKPELTRDGEATLDEVAAAYQRLKPSKVEIAGHTDRSGPNSVNLVASRRRAERARSYLTAHGVPAGVIAISAYGESRPIVPTADGVREMQNRRVEISFLGNSPAISASVALVGGNGQAVGSARLSGNSLTLEAGGLTPGAHGMHLHAVGRCDPPDFASAGPHWNPNSRKHGSANPEGPHMGDLPNLIAGADGRASLTLAVPPGLLDEDGGALIIHATADDYRTDPSGNSGARIACAAFTR